MLPGLSRALTLPKTWPSVEPPSRPSGWLPSRPVDQGVELTASQGADKPAPATPNFLSPNWWGVSEVNSLVDELKTKANSPGQWNVWLEWLKPFFPFIPILPYTFIALLTEEQLINLLSNNEANSILPLDGLIACAGHYIKIRERYHCGKNEVLVRSLWAYIEEQLASRRVEDAIRGLNVLSLAFPHLLPSDSHVYENYGFLPMSSTYLTLWDASRGSDSAQDFAKIGKPIESSCSQLAETISTKFSYSKELDDAEVQLWTNLFECSKSCKCEELRSWWYRLVKSKLLVRLKQVGDNKVISLYCKKDLSSKMDEVIENYALSAEKIFENNPSSGNPSKMAKLVDAAISKRWHLDDSNNMAIVRQIMKWENFQSLWKFFKRSKVESQRLIKQENVERLLRSCTALEAVLKTVVDSTICFGDFEFLDEHQSKLVDLCVVTDDLNDQRTVVKEAFTLRMKELKAYDQFHSDVHNFFSSCELYSTGTEAVAQWLGRARSSLTFCAVIVPESSQDTVTIICDELPDDIRNMLDDFKRLKQRTVFYRMFTSKLSNRSRTDLIQLATVYEEAFKEYKKHVERFRSGSLSIQQLESVLMNYFDQDRIKLVSELSQELKGSLLKEREQQIKMCADLSQYHKGAKVILDFKKNFELTGDFKAMETILQSKSHMLQLKDIGSDLTNSAETLQTITEDEIRCLQTFLKCQEFIDWARDSVKENDISNFVDVAGSTLGEDDLAAQKTSSLLNALTGYSPLIHQLDKNSNYSDFMSACGKVWKSLKENPSLIKDLSDSASELEWLMKVKDNLGNMEINTIEQANAINRCGIYYVGRIHDVKDQQFKRAEDVIRLKCTVERKERVYTATDLKDLQSRLTLVAGDKQRENQETIDRFTTMKDAIENLANAYLDIRREGCIQFDELLVVIHCDETKPVGMEVRLQSIKRVLHSRNDAGADALKHCETLFQFFTQCVSRWQDIMKDHRRNSTVLNYYTTEQLVVLRKELGAFLENKKEEGLQQV
ncbi:E3 ubiquitin-protein ligase RNF213-like [Watersipora subatra]|uniref:E3 ubiquitin-protein ligase RNF213-like n=1 Tax=Watersipora subatra TaxID=2589382 RepID=UPI00355BEBAE